VQLTWVDARLLTPPTVQVAAPPAVKVLDRRSLTGDQRARFVAHRAGTVVWAEGVAPAGEVPFCDRTALREADTLVVWTTPPSPAELHDALETVSPAEVVLFAVDPGLDTPQAFLRRLGGLVKYALRSRGREVTLAALAARTAHSVPTVRLGLAWMAHRGQIQLDFQTRDRLTVCAGQGIADDRLPIVQAQLQARLEETAAYRTYFHHADAGRLVRL
jgi:hypothetical protein